MPITFTNLRIATSPSQNFPVAAWSFSSTDTTAEEPAAATITLRTNGTTSVTGGIGDETVINSTTNWYTPTTTSIGTSYWVQATLNSGNAALSGTFGSRIQLTSNTAWQWQTTTSVGVKSGQVKFDFYDAASGGSLVGTVNADFAVTPGLFAPVTNTYTTGTAATETAPAGATNVIIAVWGAGGGGGHGWFSDTDEQGGGGGSGGYVQSTYSISGGQTLTYTVGTGGAGSSTFLESGATGTTSSVATGTKSITTMTANGGTGGTATPPTDGTGGTASGGTTLNTTGNPGASGGGAEGIIGYGSNFGGVGGDGGIGTAQGGASGGSGKVIFYYT